MVLRDLLQRDDDLAVVTFLAQAPATLRSPGSRRREIRQEISAIERDGFFQAPDAGRAAGDGLVWVGGAGSQARVELRYIRPAELGFEVELNSLVRDFQQRWMIRAGVRRRESFAQA